MRRTRELTFVYDGWEGYNQSLISAISSLTPGQLAFRSSPEMRSVGEVSWHIGDGRVDWFQRLNGPGIPDLLHERQSRRENELSGELIAGWLGRTWSMVQATLQQWTVDDLAETYRQPYQGKVYAVSRQWTIWRIMAHDIHHGGQLSELLAQQGVIPLELTILGGHLTEPPLVE